MLLCVIYFLLLNTIMYRVIAYVMGKKWALCRKSGGKRGQLPARFQGDCLRQDVHTISRDDTRAMLPATLQPQIDREGACIRPVRSALPGRLLHPPSGYVHHLGPTKRPEHRLDSFLGPERRRLDQDRRPILPRLHQPQHHSGRHKGQQKPILKTQRHRLRLYLRRGIVCPAGDIRWLGHPNPRLLLGRAIPHHRGSFNILLHYEYFRDISVCLEIAVFLLEGGRTPKEMVPGVWGGDMGHVCALSGKSKEM